MKVYSFLIVLLFSSLFLKAQNQDSIILDDASYLIYPKFLNLSAEVKIVDSQYILFPKLNVLNKDSVIKIHKRLYPSNMELLTADLIIHIEKLVRCVYQTTKVESIGLRLMDEDFEKLIEFRKGDILNTNINLDHYCAFEEGRYRIMVWLKFYKNNIERTVQASDWHEFKVSFIPKNSMWGNCKE